MQGRRELINNLMTLYARATGGIKVVVGSSGIVSVAQFVMCKLTVFVTYMGYASVNS